MIYLKLSGWSGRFFVAKHMSEIPLIVAQILGVCFRLLQFWLSGPVDI
jgi:hypothetical protein